MSELNYTEQIMEIINNASREDVFVATDFLDIAEYHTVRQALLRLSKYEKIQKIMNGIYYCPQYSELLQEYEAPSPSKVAMAIARKFNWTIAPSGNTALNQLGLSTQVTAKWNYISDGPYHTFEIGGFELEFKHRNNKEISGMSYKTAMVIQALKTIGKDQITEETLVILEKQLTSEEKKKLLLEGKQTTMWIYNVIKEISEE
ncbi:MAG: DUF6088 family protein [Lachnospiraceae bacterium]